MEFTNPNFTPAPDAQDHCADHAASTDLSAEASAKEDHSLPKLRKVTNSPFREYAARPGEVAPLPDNVAALILSFKGRAEVQRNGIRVERKEISEQPMFFWHEDSLTCLGKQGEKVLYVLNPNTLDCVHIMDTHGRYIETVPRKGLPAILDPKAASKEIAAHRRYMTNQETRLQHLHGEETETILKRHRDNAEELKRATNIHPVEEMPNISPAPTPTADRIAQRGEHIQQAVDNRRSKDTSAANFGHAARDVEPAPGTDRQSPAADYSRDESAEDWSTPNPVISSGHDEEEIEDFT